MGGGGGGQPIEYQKWPEQIFLIVNFVFSNYGHLGLGGGGACKKNYLIQAWPLSSAD